VWTGGVTRGWVSIESQVTYPIQGVLDAPSGIDPGGDKTIRGSRRPITSE